MAANMKFEIVTKVSGGLFTKNIPEVCRRALREEAIDKVTERLLRRRRKGLGSQRNVISLSSRRELEADFETTLHNPRNTGRALRDKNVRITLQMAPNVLRKSAKRMAEEMG